MKKLGRKPETLIAFTERAIDATFKGALIPPLVYIPAKLRRIKDVRINVDGDVTINPATEAENVIRVGLADPVGFLIAIMQGQPIPRFIVERDGDGQKVRADFEAPPLDARLRAAEILARHKGTKLKPGDDGYDAMIARAASEGVRGKSDGEV